MELKDLIKSRNVDGKVYACDIARWLGEKIYWALSFKDRKKLQDDLSEIYAH